MWCKWLQMKLKLFPFLSFLSYYPLSLHLWPTENEELSSAGEMYDSKYILVADSSIVSAMLSGGDFEYYEKGLCWNKLNFSCKQHMCSRPLWNNQGKHMKNVIKHYAKSIIIWLGW